MASMDWGYTLLITLTAAALLLMVQRAEPKRRRLVGFFVLLGLLLIRHNAFLKGNLHEETLIAFAVALLLSGAFWLLIGRYNPVGSSDEVRVIGMDD
ncbi:MAG: hypothetical protein OXE46_13885 [Chloroflexi bacterium]|nr:hypothetical protein [Chloroflexota bacterium]